MTWTRQYYKHSFDTLPGSFSSRVTLLVTSITSLSSISFSAYGCTQNITLLSITQRGLQILYTVSLFVIILPLGIRIIPHHTKPPNQLWRMHPQHHQILYPWVIKITSVLQDSATRVALLNLSDVYGSKDPHVLPTLSLTCKGTAEA